MADPLLDPGGGGGTAPAASGNPAPPGPAPAPPGVSPPPPGQNYNLAWLAWAKGVLLGIGAPATDVNLTNLWAWTTAESPIQDPMRWNNPLNTTQPGPGASIVNTAGVRSYPSVDSGITATVQMLLNGYYPALVEALRSGTPRQQWSPAVLANITKWGTNTSFAGAGVPAPLGGGVDSSSPPGTPFFDIPNPLDSLGKAFASLNKQLVGGLQVTAGLILMLAGIAVLVLMAAKGAAPAAAKVASLGTPLGRAAAALPKPRSSPAPAPAAPAPRRSAEAESAVAAAKAGQGSKLSPQVKAELRREAA
jgi:hypothetical protein